LNDELLEAANRNNMVDDVMSTLSKLLEKV